MIRLTADFSKQIQKMKPVHGFNNCARQTDYGPVLPDFLALRPPVVRLHDTAYPYGGGHYVDVNNIFRDFSADPADAAAYDFALTDLYIEPLVKNGIEIMYRLGCNIEHAPKKYNVFPPADFQKWADICEHIVRHYNRGWADGHTWGIKYWEIWNEPDGIDPQVEPNGPPNWQGTAEDYCRLYSVTANHLKRCHPEILVGGYSSCYILGKNDGGKWVPGDTSYFTNFLRYISAPETGAPLDFFTWHGYLGNQGIGKIDTESGFVNETLNRFGFTDTLRIDAEWNCCVCDTDTPDFRTQYYINMRNTKGASHIAAALWEMQRCSVDFAMFYDAQLWKEYGPLFHVPSLEKTQTYYAFEQFGKLYALGVQCESSQQAPVYTLAASDGYTRMLALSNVSPEPVPLSIEIRGATGKRPALCDPSIPCAVKATGTGTVLELTLPGYCFTDITF